MEAPLGGSDFDSRHAATKDIATDPILASHLGGVFTLGATTAAACRDNDEYLFNERLTHADARAKLPSDLSSGNGERELEEELELELE